MSAYIAAWSTDKGICKATNQDSALLLQAESSKGDLLMAAVCDGVGGLAKGELASAYAVEQLKEWFVNELPVLLEKKEFPQMLYQSWNELVVRINRKLAAYAKDRRQNLGTTMSVLLLADSHYYILHIGDSRIYLLENGIRQLTHDQTFIQREIDEGRMTPEEAREDERRNVLLQCVGASRIIMPDFADGAFLAGQRFLLCSDGFRHEVSGEEIYRKLSGKAAPTQAQMQKGLDELVRLNMQRQETDNITAFLIQV